MGRDHMHSLVSLLSEVGGVAGDHRLHPPARVNAWGRPLGQALSAKLGSRADSLIVMGDINNNFNMHVSDGVVLGLRVTPSQKPDARARSVVRCSLSVSLSDWSVTRREPSTTLRRYLETYAPMGSAVQKQTETGSCSSGGRQIRSAQRSSKKQ